ncbi:MAG: tatA [Gemmatimonadetes bacterium]|jgi:sec-independent protein translocase protein TatA|nr:tatA [Gemmatimonadota bacterium]
MFGSFGMGEMVILLVIVLVLFGAKRIPEISASFGKGIREFKKNVNDVQESITTPDTPRYESRLPAGDPLATRPPVTQDEVRPEPKRLL